jgi:hypothetical protein
MVQSLINFRTHVQKRPTDDLLPIHRKLLENVSWKPARSRSRMSWGKSIRGSRTKLVSTTRHSARGTESPMCERANHAARGDGADQREPSRLSLHRQLFSVTSLCESFKRFKDHPVQTRIAPASGDSQR